MVCMWVLDTLLFSLGNWLRDQTSWALGGIRVKIKSVPKYFKYFLFLNFAAPRYTFLFLNFETYIVYVINCEWSRFVNFLLRMSCMQYKHVFFQKFSDLLLFWKYLWIHHSFGTRVSQTWVWHATRVPQKMATVAPTELDFFNLKMPRGIQRKHLAKSTFSQRILP